MEPLLNAHARTSTNTPPPEPHTPPPRLLPRRCRCSAASRRVLSTAFPPRHPVHCSTATRSLKPPWSTQYNNTALEESVLRFSRQRTVAIMTRTDAAPSSSVCQCSARYMQRQLHADPPLPTAHAQKRLLQQAHAPIPVCLIFTRRHRAHTKIKTQYHSEVELSEVWPTRSLCL